MFELKRNELGRKDWNKGYEIPFLKLKGLSCVSLVLCVCVWVSFFGGGGVFISVPVNYLRIPLTLLWPSKIRS